MVDSDCNLHLLEVNPGPDFKQTGTRLQSVIVSLWENTCRVILDEQQDQEPARKGEGHGQGLGERVGQLVKVYDKEWSVGMMQGGGGMKLV
jgi:tubulin---tyrosine ligase